MTRWRTVVVAALVALSTFSLVRGSMPDVPSGRWLAGAPLLTVRAGASSALLPDGTVLVTGGSGADGVHAGSELFTASGTFSAAAPMHAARSYHKTVTLRDGRVLAIGGRGADGALASAEIYSDGVWSLAGELIDGRWGHTATVLHDGRVLVAGGENGAGSLDSVEIFDPLTGAFSLAGTLASPRRSHAAAALADGRVLIAGGLDGAQVLSSVDVFDPSTGTVNSLAGALLTPRAGHSATRLLDGRVLFFGGSDGSSDLRSGEIFDPVAGTFTATTSAAGARRDHQAFLLPNNNAVLIAGGVAGGAAVASAELYLPWLDRFSTTGAMAAARVNATGSPLSEEHYGGMRGLDGRLLVAGGDGLASSEVYGFATIKTDRDDYLPGDTVYVSGAGWQPNETVTFGLRELPAEHDARSFALAADASGRISDVRLFDVEEHHFGIRFTLTARGAASQAHVTFTDGNRVTFSDTAAGSIVANFGTVSPGECRAAFVQERQGNTIDNNTHPSRVVTLTSSPSGATFFAGPACAGLPVTTVTIPATQPAAAFSFKLTTGGSYTIAGDANLPGSNNASASVSVLAPNSAPVVAADSGTVTVSEGQTAAVAGTWSDANSDDDVSVSASIGTVVTSGTNASGTWSWSYQTSDGPDDGQVVTITADDGKGGVTTTTFALSVNNVAPTVAFTAGATTVNESGVAEHLYSYSISDPGDDTVSSVSTSCGSGGTKVAGSDSHTNLSGSFRCVFPDGPASPAVTASATDSDGATGNTAQRAVTVNNVSPAIGIPAVLPEPSIEGGAVTVSAVFSDPGVNDAPFTCVVDYGDGSPVVPGLVAGATCTGPSHIYADNGSFTVSVTVADKDGGAGSNLANHDVSNAPPVLDSLTASAFTVALGSSVTVTGEYSDPGTADSHTCYADWDDGTPEQSVAGDKDLDAPTLGSCSAMRTFTQQGVYTVEMHVQDDDGAASNILTVMVTVYDPNGGFVTGGGWILSPAGASVLDPSATGKASFGFVSKYRKGSHTPEGQTEFQFKAGDLNFHSSAYDSGSLVVASYKAQYKGVGTLNGVAGYRFVLTAYDGQINGGADIDKFRMKIIREVDGAVVYDNAQGASDDIDMANPTALGGGSIVIHDGKK